jgi:hypothetical protein
MLIRGAMHLRDSIRHILSPHPVPTGCRAFIDLTLQIATIHLLKRTRAGIINPSFFGLTPEDLALDLVGPLLARDANGRFTHLEVYYASIHWESLSDAELLAATRRLVYSTVHQQLVRLYRDHDPSLEKIIRNLRNALRGTPSLHEDRRGAELWIAVASETTVHRLLPEMPWSYLEGELTGYLQERTPMRAVVQHCVAILDGQSVYRKSFPLTSLALILRMAYSRFEPDPDEQGVSTETTIRTEEADRIITNALSAIEAEKRATYVDKGKVNAQTYAAYMSAVREILRSEFVENDGTDRSYMIQLEAQIPDLTMEDYRENHRCHLEYLAKLARECFLEKMRIELQESGR